jgi:hypothetical protein
MDHHNEEKKKSDDNANNDGFEEIGGNMYKVLWTNCLKEVSFSWILIKSNMYQGIMVSFMLKHLSASEFISHPTAV